MDNPLDEILERIDQQNLRTVAVIKSLIADTHLNLAEAAPDDRWKGGQQLHVLLAVKQAIDDDPRVLEAIASRIE